ncbi:MAG: hypothetical protein QOI10_3327 [Solirubrobacterales bacterium]|nr:hypothetical protein [Solirubrobacterales bacterium]
MAGREPGRTLTELELNRALLARQLLLERARLPVPRALERIGGIQAQYAPSMYVGLWTRLEGFKRDQLTRALERRTVVQGTSLRATIHLLSPGDWWTFAAATSTRRREEWLRTRKLATAAQMGAAVKRVRPLLAKGPVERKALQETVGLGAPGISGINAWIELVRAPPSGTWEHRRADLFADAADWIGPAPKLTASEATVEVVRSYLRGFGPATTAEIADWAGLPNRQVDAARGSLELRRFRAEDGAELVDLPRLPIPAPDTPAPPRLLPVWDATTLAHARRSQILPERHRPRIFNTKTPQSMPTFLIDGRVAGSWRFEKGKLKLDPFERIDAGSRRELDREADRLAEFHA